MDLGFDLLAVCLNFLWSLQANHSQLLLSKILNTKVRSFSKGSMTLHLLYPNIWVHCSNLRAYEALVSVASSN